MNQMEVYYNYRKLIHKLYNEDTQCNGDLFSSILELRDKNKCVSAISMKLNEYNINVEFEEGTEESKKTKILDKIVNRLGIFISNNQGRLGTENDEAFQEFISDPKGLYCDVILLGDQAQIQL